MNQAQRPPSGVVGTLLAASRAIDAFSEVIGKTLLWLVLISTLVSAGNAIVRYGLNMSSNAWLEIQWYMFAAMFLLSAGYAMRHNQHVRVDLFYHRYSERTQAWVDLVGTAVFLIPTSLIMLYLSIPNVLNSFRIQEHSPDAGGLLRWPVKVLVPIGFALLTIQAISELFKRVGILSGRHALVERYEQLQQ